MNNFRYILNSAIGKSTCPHCGHENRFTRYVDTETGQPLADFVGACDRKNSCRYHFTPAMFFQSNGMRCFYKPKPGMVQTPKPDPVYINPEIVQKSVNHTLKHPEENNFIKWLLTKYDPATVERLIKTYFIGTSKHWQGATVFFQISHEKRAHRAKIMAYDINSGKRLKRENGTGIVSSWHAIQKMKDRKPKDILFGLHRVNEPGNKSIGIVESEKTAIVMAGTMPELIWMATGSVGNLTIDRLQPIRNRKIFLFPDVGYFDSWKDKASKFTGFNIEVSTLLESRCPELQGADLADVLC